MNKDLRGAAGPRALRQRRAIREVLIASGVPEEKVLRHVRTLLFPWPARMLWDVRLRLGCDAYIPEWELMRDFAESRSHADIEEALSTYRTHPLRHPSLLMWLVGTTPRTKRVWKCFQQQKGLIEK